MNQMKNKTKLNYVPKEGFTHGGIFHSDDVFATAVLRILNPLIKITRGNQVPEDFDGIVYDIGMGRYDHHQADREVRENGIPYAAFGLVWRDFGTMLMSREDAEWFDKSFVQMIDETDNTGKPNRVSECVSDFLPNWDEDIDMNQRFEDAVAFAQGILKRKFKERSSRQLANDIVRTKISQDNCPYIELEYYIPWKQAALDSDKVFVIYPSARGGYIVQGIPREAESKETRVPFPQAWRGMNQSSLEALTGIRGVTFCHNGGFLCAVETMDAARAVAKLAIEQGKIAA